MTKPWKGTLTSFCEPQSNNALLCCFGHHDHLSKWLILSKALNTNVYRNLGFCFRRTKTQFSAHSKTRLDFEAYCYKWILLDATLFPASQEHCATCNIENPTADASLATMVVSQLAHRVALQYLSKVAASSLKIPENSEAWVTEGKYWYNHCFQKILGVYDSVS